MMNEMNGSSQQRADANLGSENAGLHGSQLMQLFEDELQDIYWAEKTLSGAIPQMIRHARSQELIEALSDHLAQTNDHLLRIEQVFASIGKTATTKKCASIDGLIRDTGEMMEAYEAGAIRDAGIIAAAQKIEHYEIAAYGTLQQFAETLGLKKAVGLLLATLEEEHAADERLSEIAMTTVNNAAAQQEEVVSF